MADRWNRANSVSSSFGAPCYHPHTTNYLPPIPFIPASHQILPELESCAFGGVKRYITPRASSLSLSLGDGVFEIKPLLKSFRLPFLPPLHSAMVGVPFRR